MRERARIVLVLVLAGAALLLVCGGALWVVWYVAKQATQAGPERLPSAELRAPKLSKAEAERLLLASEFLAETAMTRLVLSRNRVFSAADLVASHPEVVKFIELGLVGFRPNSVILGQPIGARFVLTPEGERASASGWRPAVGPAGEEAWMVPTSRKRLVHVRSPKTAAQTAVCSFRWKWVPTEVGDKGGAPAGTETSSAGFYLDDDRWYLDEGSILAQTKR